MKEQTDQWSRIKGKGKQYIQLTKDSLSNGDKITVQPHTKNESKHRPDSLYKNRS